MGDPIIFAKYDGRRGHEALTIIVRPDRNTTRNERQYVIDARHLDVTAPGEIENFLKDARPIAEAEYEKRRDDPIEFLRVESDDPPGVNLN
jgi:hypothetical protein